MRPPFMIGQALRSGRAGAGQRRSGGALQETPVSMVRAAAVGGRPHRSTFW